MPGHRAISDINLGPSVPIAKGIMETIPVHGLSVTGFVFTNLTGTNITLARATIVYEVVSGVAATLDVRKVLAGANAAAAGTSVTLIVGTVNLQSNVRALQDLALTATLADRILAPLDKVSFVFSTAPTNLIGCATLLF